MAAVSAAAADLGLTTTTTTTITITRTTLIAFGDPFPGPTMNNVLETAFCRRVRVFSYTKHIGLRQLRGSACLLSYLSLD